MALGPTSGPWPLPFALALSSLQWPLALARAPWHVHPNLLVFRLRARARVKAKGPRAWARASNILDIIQ